MIPVVYITKLSGESLLSVMETSDILYVNITADTECKYD